jgi:hypothetical protein
MHMPRLPEQSASSRHSRLSGRDWTLVASLVPASACGARMSESGWLAAVRPRFEIKRDQPRNQVLVQDHNGLSHPVVPLGDRLGRER